MATLVFLFVAFIFLTGLPVSVSRFGGLLENVCVQFVGAVFWFFGLRKANPIQAAGSSPISPDVFPKRLVELNI